MPNSLEKRLRIIEDKDAILQTKLRSLKGRDNSDIDMVMSCFARECSAVYSSGTHADRAAVEKHFNRPSPFAFILHRISNVMIDVIDETHAEFHCYCDAPVTHKETNKAVWIANMFDDDFVKEDGKWLIKKATATRIYASDFEKGWAKERFSI